MGRRSTAGDAVLHGVVTPLNVEACSSVKFSHPLSLLPSFSLSLSHTHTHTPFHSLHPPPLPRGRGGTG